MSGIIEPIGYNIAANYITNLFVEWKKNKDAKTSTPESIFILNFYSFIIDELCDKFPKLTPPHLYIFLEKENVHLAITEYLNDFENEKMFTKLKREFKDEIEGDYFSEEDIENILHSFTWALVKNIEKDDKMRSILIFRQNAQMYSLLSDMKNTIEFKNVPNIEHQIKNNYLENIPSTDHFIGRKEEIDYFLNIKEKIIIVEGISGIGKTYLCAKVGNELKSKNNIFWYTFNEASTLNSLLNKLLTFINSINTVPHFESLLNDNLDLNTKITLILKNLDKQPVILFFDDYHRSKDEKIDLIFEIIKNNDIDLKVYLITQPQPFLSLYNPDDIFHKKCNLEIVKGLTYKDVSHFFEIAGLNFSEKYMSAIYKTTEGHPVALQLFLSAIQNGYDLENLINNSPSTPDNLMHYLFKKVYSKLSLDEKNLLKAMSIFRVPVSLEILNFMCDNNNLVETTLSLDEKLLIRKNDLFYSIHPILQLPSYLLISNKDKYHNKAASYFENQEHISLEESLEFMYHLINSTRHEDAASIAIQLNFLYIQNGYSASFLEILNLIIGKILPPKIKIYIGTIIGNIYASQKKYVDAENVFQEMIELSTEISYINGESSLLNNLSSICMEKGEFNKALKLQFNSLNLYNKHEDANGKAHVLLNIASNYLLCNMLDKSKKYALKSLQVIDSINNKEQEISYTDYFLNSRVASGAFNLLAKIHEKQRHFSLAFDYYKRSKKYALLSGNYSLASVNSGDLGTLYAQMMDIENSEIEYLDELKYAKITNEIDHIHSAYDHLGNCYSDFKMYPKALEYYTKSLEISLNYKMYESAAITYMHMTFDLINQKDFNQAIENCRKNIKYAKKSDSLDSIALAFLHLAQIKIEFQEYTHALRLCAKVLAYPDEEDMIPIKISSYELIGDIYVKNKQYSNAALNYEKCLELLEEISNWYVWFSISQKLIDIYFDQNKHDNVLNILDKLNLNHNLIHVVETQKNVYEYLIVNYKRLEQYKKVKSLLVSKINYELTNGFKSEAIKTCNTYSAFLRAQKKLVAAMHVAKISIRLSLEEKDNYNLSIAYLTFGNVLLALNKHDEAILYYSKSAILKSSMGCKKETITSYFNLASVFGSTNKNEKKKDILDVVEILCGKYNVSFENMSGFIVNYQSNIEYTDFEKRILNQTSYH